MNHTPAVSPWLWGSLFAQTLAAGADAQVARALREARLASLLAAARASPLYRERLQHAPVHGSDDLHALEPVAKAELMQRFDDWATDRAVTRSAVDRFLETSHDLADAFLGRYLVWTSSGTSGTPGIFVQDEGSLAAYEVLDALRLRSQTSYATLPLTAWSAGQRFAFVAATGGRFAGAVAITRLVRLHSAWSWLAPQISTFSVLTPLAQLAAELQQWQPTVLITYPSCAVALARLQLAGGLTLRLSELWLGGEQLSTGQRALLRRAFGCPLRNNYGASEFFTIACECEHERLHLNDDWLILEPVDRQLRPLPAGEPSHAVLLTHLANHVQPLLRYRLDDAVRFTGEACACGSRLPVIEVQGRSGHTLVMHDERDREVTLLPLALETAIEEGAQVTHFQLLCTAPDALELRLEPEVADPVAAFGRAQAALRAFLAGHGLGQVRIEHGRRPPLRERASGKLCRVRMAPREPDA
ncbi:MAG: phenylacetate--CoA ligase family protein [Burkholderiaceae bacterium]|nr:phenylacetate--CoA ligase family protein [Ideonella sp.]MCC7285920.1 phenylacetate--CoA ligase family protein [Burkholderiaceae bacterium]